MFFFGGSPCWLVVKGEARETSLCGAGPLNVDFKFGTGPSAQP